MDSSTQTATNTTTSATVINNTNNQLQKTPILYALPHSLQKLKIEFVSKFLCVDIDEPDSDFVYGVDSIPVSQPNNDNQNYPVLFIDEKNIVNNSNAILKYLCLISNRKEEMLRSNDLLKSVLVDQWIYFSMTNIELPRRAWLGPLRGLFDENKAATSQAKRDIRNALASVEQNLSEHKFLIDDTLSLADFVIAMALFPLFELVLDPPFMKKFPNTMQWFQSIVNMNELTQLLPTKQFIFCQKMKTVNQ